MLRSIDVDRHSSGETKRQNKKLNRQCNVMYSCNLYSFKIYYVLCHTTLLPSKSVEQNLLNCSAAVIESAQDQKLPVFIFRH